MPTKPEPTWINDEFIHGPLYHYERLTESQALSLGVHPLPKAGFGQVSRMGGATARRLRNGLINVVVPHGSPLLRSKRFGRFMDALQPDVAPCCCETIPVPIDNEFGLGPLDLERAGHWSYEVETERFIGSSRCNEIHGVPAGKKLMLQDVLELFHPLDVDRMQNALNDSAYLDKPFDEVYRVIVNSEVREIHAKGRVHDASARGMTHRVAGVALQVMSRVPAMSTVGRFLGSLVVALSVSVPDAPMSRSYGMADENTERVIRSKVLA